MAADVMIPDRTNVEIAASQSQQILELYPQGARAIELLIEGRNLVYRLRERTVSMDECMRYVQAVDFILGPLDRVNHG
jgi:hypothetical protein